VAVTRWCWRRASPKPTTPRLPTVSYDEALSGADAVVLAVPGDALEDLLRDNAARLDGRLLLDATNNIHLARYSQLELFERYTPSARVARVWCALGYENFLEPVVNGERLQLLWCGPDGEDGALIETLVRDGGLEPYRSRWPRLRRSPRRRDTHHPRSDLSRRPQLTLRATRRRGSERRLIGRGVGRTRRGRPPRHW
jgi:hypothetical protein